MKRKMHIFLIAFLAVLFVTGCHGKPGEEDADLKRLAQIEVYSKDGELINTITDKEILYQFSNLESMNDLDDTDAIDEADIIDSTGIADGVNPLDEADSRQEGITDGAEEPAVLYTVISYKKPVAVINDGSLEKELEMTIYEDSNVVKEQIALEMAVGVPEEFLTFYMIVSEEDRNFLLSLAD